MVEHPTILKPTIVEKMVNFEKKPTIFKSAQFIKYQSVFLFFCLFLVLHIANTIDDLHDFQ